MADNDWRARQDAQREAADELDDAGRALHRGFDALRGTPERRCSCGALVAVGYSECPNGHPYYGD